MSDKIELYKHQKQFVKKISKQFRKGNKHVIGQSPTGSGKTIMFSHIASEASRKGKRVLIVTDRAELLLQAGGTIEKFDMNPFYVKQGVRFLNRKKSVYIGMSQTLRNRLKKPLWLDFFKKEIDLFIIDEAHKQEFNHLFSLDFLADKFVLGVTATPFRSGKMVQLGIQYDTIVTGKPIKWLIKKGYLLNCDIYDCGTPDMSGVSINRAKGDFSESSMFKKYDDSKLYKGLVKNYLKMTPGQKMMVFCCNVEHAIKTTKELHKAGVDAKFIASAKTAPKEPKKWTPATKAVFDEKFRSYKLYEKWAGKLSGERKRVFDWFKKSKDGVLVNVDIATTGFDDPSVQVISLYRATMSLVLYYQMIGRGSRTVKDGSMIKTHFTVLDFGGNKARFGPYDVDRDWSLWHEESKPGGGIPPMKICGEDSKFNDLKGDGKVKKGCKRLIMATYKICPFCGFKYPLKDKAKEIDLVLSEITDENGVSLKQKSFKDMTFEELTKYREIKKHHLNWLYLMIWKQGEEAAIKRYASQYNWSSRRIYKVLQICNSKFKK
jgi:superfamily II DNA or RNA helicase